MADIRIKDLPLNTPVLSTDIFVFEKNIGGGTYVTSRNVLSVLGSGGGNGAQGVQGVGGTSQGSQGTQGIGSQGVQGLSNQGVQGLSNQGVQGTIGSQGTTGDQGIQGLQGIGDQGVQGLQGVSNQGVQGIFGDQGVQGLQGISNQGIQGVAGSMQGVQGNIGTTFDYTEVTSNITLESNNGYIFDTTSGALTVTLPASPNTGDYINITLTRGGSNNLTIDRNGKSIDGEALNVVCDVSGTFSLIYVGSANNWKFVPFSGLTTPVIKIYKATWLGPYATSGTADNLGNNSRVPYNTNAINTDSETFGGLQNPGSKTQTSILVKKTGYYRITSNLHLFDQAEDRNLYVQLWTFDSTNSDVLRTAISDYRGPGTATSNDLIIKGDYVLNITQPNTFIYIVVNHDFPGDGPYPSDNDSISGGSSAPTEITITKIA